MYDRANLFVTSTQIGAKRVEAAAQKGNTYSLGLLFDKKKAQWTEHQLVKQ